MSQEKKTKKEKGNLSVIIHGDIMAQKQEWLLPMLPILLFACVTILIVRMHIYQRPMSQFFWTNETDESQLTDFFSYNKMVFIIAVTCFAAILILFQIITKSMTIKRSALYVPMGIYAIFVILSYIGSDYKVFSIWGYNDRFEGTIVLLCYMLMLFFVINNINSERNIRLLLFGIAIMTIILGLIGISQGTDHDFFKTSIGQKLIAPNYVLSNGSRLWDAIDFMMENGSLYFNFTFKNKEAYQTVYNPNYVAFYLTLLIPIFGMLFIRAFDKNSEEFLSKKIALLVLFALMIYNFIASKSAGGFLGIGVMGLIGIIMLNKQLLSIWKPLVILFVVTGIVFGLTTDAWLPEIKNSLRGFREDSRNYTVSTSSYANTKPFVDYIKTNDRIEFSINGNPIKINTDSSNGYLTLNAVDNNGGVLQLHQEDDGYLSVIDDRFYDYIKMGLVKDESGKIIVDINTDGMHDWYFVKDDGIFYYINGLGNRVSLDEVAHKGFENHLHFGSDRGYIWSASIPLLLKRIVIGSGADTFCLVFPHSDYAWKYNSGYNRDIIVDKPHNMYIAAGIGTGVLSLVALIAIYGIYVVQSIRIYWKRQLGVDYLHFVGFGIFCGVTAFMFTGLLDDSSVSVMPLFYSLLGCGVAVNHMIESKQLSNK